MTRWAPGARDTTYRLAKPAPIEFVATQLAEARVSGSMAVSGLRVVSRTRARGRATAEYGWYCVLTTYDPEIISVSGNYKARGRGKQSCVNTDGDAISGFLWRRDGSWSLLATGQGVDSVSETYDCNHTRSLLYQQVDNGQALVNNHWYIGPYGWREKYHTCPG
ncbi:MAG: hypothetical protein JW940_06050 [Polyangiaceae bacterium]|nr:hypothetical protein [Polyangiaceae bacterium]